MKQNLEIKTITCNVIDDIKDYPMFSKYNIDAQIEEINRSEKEAKLKYNFTFVSEPKKIRMNIAGVTTLEGDGKDIDKCLEPDKNSLPNVVHLIYQEILPLLYVMTKGMNVPCPIHNLSLGVSQPSEIPAQPDTDSKMTEKSVKDTEMKENETETVPEPVVSTNEIHTDG